VPLNLKFTIGGTTYLFLTLKNVGLSFPHISNFGKNKKCQEFHQTK
jgi:hypothetical protein